MAYPALAVCNYFIRLAAASYKNLTPMQLQKLTAIAHGWNLALSDTPLIDEPIEAWKYGPVIRKLYHQLKNYGAEPVPFIENVTEIDERDEKVKAILNAVWEIYGDQPASVLSALTHRSGTPWRECYERANRDIVIPDKKIKLHYEELLNSQYGFSI